MGVALSSWTLGMVIRGPNIPTFFQWRRTTSCRSSNPNPNPRCWSSILLLWREFDSSNLLLEVWKQTSSVHFGACFVCWKILNPLRCSLSSPSSKKLINFLCSSTYFLVVARVSTPPRFLISPSRARTTLCRIGPPCRRPMPATGHAAS